VQVFDFLKAVILKSFKDEERRVASKWMQGLLEINCVSSTFLVCGSY